MTSSAHGATRHTPHPWSRHLVVVVVGVAVLGTGCSSGDITRSGLQASVGTAYQRLYLLQQHELGHTAAAAPDSSTACVRSGSTARSGPGSWTCTVHFPYPDGHIIPVTFDVEVQPVGCYVATGPPAVVGQLALTTPAGSSVTNPLYAFDGCFDAA